jgi:hypothetical protein
VADGDAKRQRPGSKDVALRSLSVRALFGRIDLDLVLKPGDRSIPIDHQRGRQQDAVDDALGAENDGDAPRASGGGDGRPGALEEDRIRRRHPSPGGAIARHEALRKADDIRARGRSLRDGVFSERHRLGRRRRKPEIGKRDSDHGHFRREASTTRSRCAALHALGRRRGRAETGAGDVACEMFDDIARVVLCAMDEGGLAAPEDGQSDGVHSRRFDHAAVMSQMPLAIDSQGRRASCSRGEIRSPR